MDATQLSRRRALATSLGLAGISLVGIRPSFAAAERVITPAQGAGPFYPVTLPLDSDNDLVRVDGRSGVAMGEVTNVVGQVRDGAGRPVPGTLVEIWQCDANGRYRHPRDQDGLPLDENFQGYGRFTTGDDGRYRFRTIRPVPYPGRAPHIHFAVRGPGLESFVTQMYVGGAPDNARDGLLNRIRDPRARASLIVDLAPDPAIPGELAGRFDIVLG